MLIVKALVALVFFGIAALHEDYRNMTKQSVTIKVKNVSVIV